MIHDEPHHPPKDVQFGATERLAVRPPEPIAVTISGVTATTGEGRTWRLTAPQRRLLLENGYLGQSFRLLARERGWRALWRGGLDLMIGSPRFAVRRLLHRITSSASVSAILGSPIVSLTVHTSVGDMAFHSQGFNGWTFSHIVAMNQYRVPALAGKTVVDAGANVGTFAIFSARLGASKVHAFEPAPDTRALLRRNVALNGLDGVIEIHPHALGSGSGQVVLATSGLPGDEGASLSPADPRLQRIAVTLTTLDSINVCPHMIKMDVEGWEAEVLRGAERTIREHGPMLSFSAYHHPDDDQTLARLVQSIEPAYRCDLVNYGEPDLVCWCPATRPAIRRTRATA